MSIVMELRKCPNCKKTYSWNPDARKFFCPHCLGGAQPDKKPKPSIKKK